VRSSSPVAALHHPRHPAAHSQRPLPAGPYYLVADTHAGLARIDGLCKKEEFAWLENRVRTEPRVRASPYRILLNRFAHWKPGERGNDYHQLILAPGQVARVEAGAQSLRVTVVSSKDGASVAAIEAPVRRRP
jgi:hypothetical protein